MITLLPKNKHRFHILPGRLLAVLMLAVFIGTTTAAPVMALDPDQAKIYNNDLHWFKFKDELVTNACGGAGAGGPTNIAVGKDFNLGPLDNTLNRPVALMQALIRDFTLTPEQAAGIVGNFMAESGGENLPPNINEGGKAGPPAFSGGYGWAQWTGSRQTTFIAYVTPPQNTFMASKTVDATDAANYAYFTKELSGPYKNNTLGPVKGAGTVTDAARLFEAGFERPAASNAAVRGQLGEKALAAFKGGGGATGTTGTSSTAGTAACITPTAGVNCTDSPSCAKLLLQMTTEGKVVLQAGGTTDLTTAAANKQITSCPQGPVALNVTLLKLLIKLANDLQAQSPNLKLAIHNFVSPPWHSCDGLFHTKGRASDVHVDGVPGDVGQHLDTIPDYQLPENKKFAQNVMDSLPPGGGLGQKEYIGALANTAGKRYFTDGDHHFHIDVGANAK